MQPRYIIAHEDGAGETQSWQQCEGGWSGGGLRAIRQASERTIAEAGRRLRAGELVAFPTETVYGLGADATNEWRRRPRLRRQVAPAL